MTVRLEADIAGPDGAPVLVLLNSIGTTTAMWDPCLGPLTEQFRVVRVDTRGHGRSPAAAPGEPATIADLGRDVDAALERICTELRVSRVHVAGLSLGGMVAMWLAAHRPQRVARLALLCTAAHLPPAQGWLDRAAAVRAAGMSALGGLPGRLWITTALAQRDPELLASLDDMLAASDPESYAQCCEAIAGMDLRADLGRIAAPTLVITGADDPAMPPATAQVMVDGIDGARLASVAPAAHIATVEAPGRITGLLLEHFGGGATLEAGLRTRRAVLGDEHVDRAIAATTELTAPFQQFLTRYAWGDVWSRPGLPRRDRSIATIAALVALGAENEIPMHIRAGVRNGLPPAQLAEVLLHVALYAGLPRANRAFALAAQALAEYDAAAVEPTP
jgi:3-oxoadipate enol-lactonase/4-carboxymuconolactone decarboxylase